MRYIDRNSRAEEAISSIDRWTPPPAPPHRGNAHAVCKLRPCGEKMATPKSARCYEHEAIDPFHAQEAQQTCWVEKEKYESARQAT